MARENAAVKGVYYDEEECLGFDLFVAELELVTSSQKDKKPDSMQLLELLPKLIASVERAEKPLIKQYQKRCESVLVDVLQKGVAAAVRRLLYACLLKLYTLGDMLPMYSTVSSLQAFLTSKDALTPKTTEAARIGALECVAYLVVNQGRWLASSAADNISLANKLLFSSLTSVNVRVAALKLVTAVVDGLGPMDRSAAAMQLEAWKIYDKYSKVDGLLMSLSTKDRTNDDVRTAAVGILVAVVRAGAVVLWTVGGWYYEEAIRQCVAGLEDPSQAVRDMYAVALGELAAAPNQSTAAAAVAAEKKPARKASLEKALEGCVKSCLSQPFTDAALHNKKDACTGLALAWTTYLAAMQQRHGMDEDGLAGAALQAIAALVAVGEPPQKAPETDLGSCLAGGELPHAQACIIYVLRVGVAEGLSEAGQRKLLERFLAVVSQGKGVAGVVVACEAAGMLLEVLGEAPEDVAQKVEDALLNRTGIDSCPSSDSAALRYQAAAVLAGLAAAAPSCAARLTESCLEALSSAVDRLAAAARPVAGKDLPYFVPARGSTEDRSREAANAVHGYALAVAALLVAGVRLPLGVPFRLPIAAWEAARTMIRQPRCTVASQKAVEREAGFVLLGALCVVLPPEVIQQAQDEMLGLFALALGPDARSEVEKLMAGQESELATALWWRAAALQALSAYILGVVGRGLSVDLPRQVRQITEMLSPVLAAITSQPTLADPSKARGGPGGWVAAAAATLQLRLLEVYFFLPGTHMFSADHAPLIKLCAKPLRGGSAAVTPEVAAAVARSSLRQVLNSGDAPLGPWLPGRDQLEDELRAFAGERGGPQQHPWEAGMAFTSALLGGEQQDGPGGESPGASSLRAVRRFMPFPQPFALGLGLLEVQLWLLGKMLAVISPKNQLQVLEVLLGALQPQQPKAVVVVRVAKQAAAAAALRQAMCVCAATAVLAGLAPSSSKRMRASTDETERTAEKVWALANALLEDNTGDLALCRAAAECMAAAACIGSDGLGVTLVKQLCADIRSSLDANKDVEKRAALALALGCIHRAKGGMAMQSVEGMSVEALMAVAARPSGSTHLWALHSLWLIATAVGPSYTNKVRSTMELAQGLLVSGADSPMLKPAAARLANAMVAVLGPEFTIGSSYYQRAKSLVMDVSGPDGGADAVGGFSTEASYSEMETVLFAQQLILFSPRAVPPRKHIPLLQAALASQRPAIRRVAAATLRHLAERDAAAILPDAIERSLFAALDSETDAGTAAQLRASIQTLQAAGAVVAPSFWLMVLGDVALARMPTKQGSGTGMPNASLGGTTASSSRQDLALDDDDDGERSAPAPAPPPPAADNRSSRGGTAPRNSLAAPRLRTRLFAADCLLQMFRVIAEDPRHADAAVLPGGENTSRPEGDFLLLHLQPLVDMGFRMATGDTEALKPSGARLLQHVILHFGRVPDPLLPEARLLEQAQAQLVSALRSTLSRSGQSPSLCASGGALATTFLESGLAAGDAAVMRRLMDLLTMPLAKWAELQYGQYAEWAGVRAKVSLLQAHAECARIATGSQSEDDLCASIVNKAQSPYKELLVVMWAALLQDALVLATQHPLVAASYTSPLYGASSPASLAAIRTTYSAASPVVLDAVTASLADPTALAAAKALAGPRQSISPSDWISLVAAATSMPSNTAALRDWAWPLYCLLLDVALMSVSDTALQLAPFAGGASSGDVPEEGLDALAAKVVSSLAGLRRLLCGDNLAQQLCPPHMVLDLLRILTALPLQVLAPLQSQVWRGAASHSQSVTTILSALSSTLQDFSVQVPESYYASSPDLVTSLTEAVLAAASVLVPYTPADSAGTRQYTALPAPPRPAAETAQADQALVAVLTAAQALTKKAPLPALESLAQPLSELGIHMLATGSPGLQLNAAQRYMSSCMATISDRLASSQEASSSGREAGVTALAAATQALCRMLHSAVEGLPLALPRLQALLSCLMAAAPLLTTAGGDGSAAELCSGVQRQCLGALCRALQPGVPAAACAKVLEAVRVALQEGSQEQPAGRKAAWAQQLASCLGPSVAASVHSSLGASSSPLGADEVAAVTEALKLLVAAGTLSSGKEQEQVAVMRVLVALLVETASPPGAVTPVLRDISIKLVMALPNSASGAAFRTVAAALPADLKTRLQAAVRESTAAAAAAPSAAAPGAAPPVLVAPKAPTIQLKAFGVPAR